MDIQIEQKTILHVARLARLDLEPGDVSTIPAELAQILDYLRQLDELDLTAVEPFFGTTEHANRTRADRVTPGLPRDQVLHNAPDSDGEYYCVPPVFG
jgi:aspartyl-tRNA(Asn)/glutamyl-tRNA(Gln) amidotransferase subunit C